MSVKWKKKIDNVFIAQIIQRKKNETSYIRTYQCLTAF